MALMTQDGARLDLSWSVATATAFDVTVDLLVPQLQEGVVADSPIVPAPGLTGASTRAADMLRVRSLAERRAAVVQRLTAAQGQSRAFFIALAASIGVSITIDEFPVAVADVSVADDVLYEQEWAWIWRVNAPSIPAIEAIADESTADDPLAQAANPPLECLIDRLKPAHTRVLYNYGS